MPIANPVTAREKGAAPLSIGTSLALEGLAGFGEYPSEKPPIDQHDELWVNLRTLYRNCFSAIPTVSRGQLQAKWLLDGLLEDARILVSTLENRSSRPFSVHFYFCDYSDLERQFPNAKHRKLRTAKQEIDRAVEMETYKLFYKARNTPNDLSLRHYDTRMTDRGEKTLVLTHLPLDLLWRNQCRQLNLLESHTGIIKPKAMWYTKLTNGVNLTRIPFNGLSLQVFGENLLFSAQPLGIKNRILELAEQDQWTSVTTDERVRASLKKLYDPRERTFFLSLLDSVKQ